MIIDNRIKELKIILPNAPTPVGAYVAYKKIENLVFISGQLSIEPNGNIITGKIGSKLKIEDGQKAAYACAINILSQIKSACNGDLDKVINCVKITGFVNSTDDFVDQPKVINPASELLTAVFSEAGKHARAAVSVSSLPLGAAVEIDAIFQVKE